MLFHTFSSQEERRKFGGSYFIELQYCGLAQGTGIKKIVSAATIEDWKMDSLYIYGDDGNQFVSQAGSIATKRAGWWMCMESIIILKSKPVL